MQTIRPWGSFETLVSGDPNQELKYLVKRIIISPGKRFSLQTHQFREEHWVVVEGTGRITIDDTVHKVSTGDYLWIPKRAKHRAENIGDADLILIETQIGKILSEDDIIRLEDDFGRK